MSIEAFSLPSLLTLNTNQGAVTFAGNAIRREIGQSRTSNPKCPRCQGRLRIIAAIHIPPMQTSVGPGERQLAASHDVAPSCCTSTARPGPDRTHCNEAAKKPAPTQLRFIWASMLPVHTLPPLVVPTVCDFLTTDPQEIRLTELCSLVIISHPLRFQPCRLKTFESVIGQSGENMGFSRKHSMYFSRLSEFHPASAPISKWRATCRDGRGCN
jgi:hypothetical protein